MSALLLGLLVLTPTVERLERETQDVRLALRGNRTTRAKIVIAEVRQSTLDTWRTVPIALWGGNFAKMIHQARRHGASVVGLDIVQDVPSDEYRIQFMDEVLQLGALTREERARLKEKADNSVGFWPLRQLVLEVVRDPDRPVVFGTIQGNRSFVQNQIWFGTGIPPQLGLVELPDQLDEVVRTMPLYLQAEDTYTPSFSACLAAVVLGRSPSHGALLNLVGSSVGERTSPQFRLNYLGTDLTGAFPRVAAEDLALGRLTASQRRDLRDAVVLIGPTFYASGDLHRGPFRTRFPGVYFHAQAISTLLDGTALHRLPPAQEVLMAQLLGLIGAGIAIAKLRRRTAVLSVVAIGFTWYGLAQASFNSLHLLLPAAAPLLTLLGAFSVSIVAGAVEANYSRIRSLLKVYLSPGIAEYLLQSPPSRQWDRNTAMATVFVVDIRDSTRLAASMEPGAMMEELNQLFSAIVPCVEENGGLVYQYNGDGFIAVFGAPSGLPGHAQAAVDTAMEIIQAVERVNQGRRGLGLPSWGIGCGVHSGPLAYGNLGSDNRTSFTVIGDTVNVAFRLEELNKRAHSQLMISSDTYDCLRDRPDLSGPTSAVVKGREAPVSVYFWKREPTSSASGSDSTDPMLALLAGATQGSGS